MLLKCTNSDRKVIISSKGGGNNVATTSIGARGTGMRMTMATASTMSARVHRKGFRTPSKRYPTGKGQPGKLHSISRIGPGKMQPGKRIPQRPHPPPCDNSNDSGFGFDQHVEHVQHSQPIIRAVPSSRSALIDGEHDEICTDDSSNDFYANSNSGSCYNSPTTTTPTTIETITTNRLQQTKALKRRKIESIVDIDNDDACSEDAFIHKIATATSTIIPIDDTINLNNNNNNNNNNSIKFNTNIINNNNSQALLSSSSSHAPTQKYLASGNRSNVRAGLKKPAVQAQNNVATSSNGRVQLEIVSQPEQQHRARYQTEGSRGAVKDRSGNGFPIVRITGYTKVTTLQVFIGTDIGRVAPHMFYQACKVAGKNSTPCNEKKVDGTMIIEIEVKPDTDMTVTCDCVGILKERNVDVEHRFPDHLAQKNKKKSTRCRMVFRTQLTHDDGTLETLQICSNPIICTQPPGVPEICKKSLNSCPVEGGLEMFVIGKNFLKDTCIVFRECIDDPQSLVMDQMEPVWEQTVLPDKEYLQQTHLVFNVPPYLHQNLHKPITVEFFIMSSNKKSEPHTFVYTPKGTYTTLSAATTLNSLHGGTLTNGQDVHYLDNGQSAQQQICSPTATNSTVNQIWGNGGSPLEPKHEFDAGMMPPPSTTNIPIGVRRPSAPSAMLTDQLVQMNGGLKTEIMDENSSHSIAETMQTDSMDQFPVTVNDNNSTTVSNDSPLKNVLEYNRLMDMQTMPIMNDSNNLQNYATHQNGHMSAVEMAVNLSAAAVVQQNQQTVDKFLCSLDANMTDLKLQGQEKPVTMNSLFVNGTQNTPNGLYTTSPTADHISSVIAANNSAIDQTLSNILNNHSPPTAVAMTQILKMSPQSESPKLIRSSSISSSSSSASSNGFDSPLSHDIILNSNSAASLNNLLMSSTSPSNSSSSSEHMSTDMILNPTVSPTILCPPTSDQNMIANQVAMANSLLSEIALAPQTAQETLMNDIIMAGTANVAVQQQQQQQQQQPPPPTPASTAVSNMIIKVAADLITNRENMTTESTLNALMSLNSSPIQTQSQVTQMLNSQATTASVLSTGDPHSMCQSQSFMTGHHSMAQEVTPNSIGNVPLVDMLLSQGAVTNPTTVVSEDFLHNLQKANQMELAGVVTSPRNQESLMQAVSSITENSIPKHHPVNVTVQQDIHTINAQNTVMATEKTAPAQTPAILQDITRMSDQDLISYINPSTFDQV